ncbi:NAD(P)-binding protein [Fistulina hepatica ATCC 64428]|uniref:NAD(P)-binding protein n=1 Tax=Fistulina hepatica ATCC 64428 TaxID=1128425 RepID=A0A0D7ASL0_9AGAR|nr:NAD(P)-binding protein [Fistulina hepatica ATCC 64428]
MPALLKNVILVGGAGNIGKAILTALTSSGQFNVSVLSRKSSTATFPEGITVHKTDYTPASLAVALKGQDAIVSAIGAQGLEDLQIALIDAAILVGVKRFIPSEYGCDLAHPKTLSMAPVYGQKKHVTDYLKSKQDKIEWTVLSTGLFADWLIHSGGLTIDLKESTATIWDEGTTPFATTTLRDIGTAIVGILTHPTETTNKDIYIASAIPTQNELVAVLEKKQGKIWTKKHVKLQEEVGKANAELAKGNIAAAGLPLVLSTLFDGCGADFLGNGRVLSNTLLGLPEPNLEAMLKSVGL